MIELREVKKNYGDKTALDNLSLTINSGELFGLLGPNGAGKTTTINLLSSLSKADSGYICINGLNLTENIKKIKRLIGLIPQELSLYEDLSAWDNLLFWGKLYDLKIGILKDKASQLLKSIDLYNKRNALVKTYSGGMKRRLNIIIGLLHDPSIIFLDEPTVGVDTQSRSFIFDMIKSLNKEGKTIIYTSHYIEEIEKLCTRVGIIDYGKIIALGTVSELCNSLNFDEKIELVYSNMADKTKTDSIILKGHEVKEKIFETLQYLNNNNQNIENLIYTKTNLEEVFLHLTGRSLRED